MRSDSQSIDAYQLERILREAGVEPAAPVQGRHALADAFGHSFADPCGNPLDGTEADAGSRLLRPLSEQIAELERRAIEASLKANAGNKLATARQLGISRATLYGRLENPGK